MRCSAVLTLEGEHCPCDLEEGHIDLAHSSRKAQAIWSPVPRPEHDLMRLKMVTELDQALHGTTVARDASPQEVWLDLLGKVRLLADIHMLKP